MNRKALGAVVATSLLIIVAVATVVSFQSWYQTFSSETQSGVEQRSESGIINSGIETIVGNDLYFKNNYGENITISSITVGNNDCGVSGNYSEGINFISLENCTQFLTTSTPDVTVITNKGVFVKRFYLKEVPNAFASRNLNLLNKSLITVFDVSGFQSGYPASNSFDNDEGTRWGSGHPVPTWISFDLGSVVNIGKMSLLARPESLGLCYSTPCYKYLIQYNSTGTWQTIYDQNTLTFPGRYNYTFDNLNTRYVRIYFYESNDWSSWTSLWEIDFYIEE